MDEEVDEVSERERLNQFLKETQEQEFLRRSEERRFLYADVEQLIEYGHFTHAYRLGSSTIVLRSLKPSEIRKCVLKAHHSDDSLGFLRWCLASSTWMVNGYEVSQDPRDNGPYLMFKEWVEDLPDSHVKALGSTLFGFRNRIDKALALTEAFCYEPYGRALWRTMGKPSELRDTNPVLRMWAAHNMSEDARYLEDLEWHRTRLIVGSMSGKAADKLSHHMEKEKEREDKRRNKVIESSVNYVISGSYEEDGIEVVLDGQTIKIPRVFQPETLEDLEAEMHKVISGQLDFHDQAVEGYRDQAARRAEERERERMRVLEEARARREAAEENPEIPNLVGYTADQLAALKPQTSYRPTTTMFEGEGNQRLTDRYVRPRMRAGVLNPDLKITDVSPQQNKPVSLQEQFAGRKPKVNE